MIKVFYGEDRVRARKLIAEFLGEDYESFEGAELKTTDLPNIFWGRSLFSAERAILILDFFENKAVAEEIGKYLNTEHRIAILETKVSKASKIYKDLQGKVEFFECKLPEDKDLKMVFDIFQTAKRDGKKAVEMVEKIEEKEEALKFEGLLATQVVKDFGFRQGAKEKRILRELAKMDMEIKTSGKEPWMLIKAFLLRVKDL